jgi:N-methylhydantoinase A
MLASFISEDVGIPKIIVPAIASGVFNSWGMINYDVRHEALKTHVMPLNDTPNNLKKLNEVFEGLEEGVNTTLDEEGINTSKIRVERFIELKYEGQAYTLKIKVSNKELKSQDLKRIKGGFHRAHFREYGFKQETTVEAVNFHVVGVHKISPIKIEKKQVKGALKDAVIGRRDVYEGKETSVLVYKKEKIPTSAAFKGPCIVEADTATTIVNKGFKVKRDLYGNLIMVR